MTREEIAAEIKSTEHKLANLRERLEQPDHDGPGFYCLTRDKSNRKITWVSDRPPAPTIQVTSIGLLTPGNVLNANMLNGDRRSPLIHSFECGPAARRRNNRPRQKQDGVSQAAPSLS